MRLLGWALIQHDCQHTENRPSEGTSTRGCLHANQRGQKGNQTCSPLDLGFQPPDAEKINSCCLNLLACNMLLWQLWQTNTMTLGGIGIFFIMRIRKNGLYLLEIQNVAFTSN